MTCGKRSAVKCVRLSCGELSIVLCAWLSMRRFCQNLHREGSLQSKNLYLSRFFCSVSRGHSLKLYVHTMAVLAELKMKSGEFVAHARGFCADGIQHITNLHSAGLTDLRSQQLKVACIPQRTAKILHRGFRGNSEPPSFCWASPTQLVDIRERPRQTQRLSVCAVEWPGRSAPGNPLQLFFFPSSC